MRHSQIAPAAIRLFACSAIGQPAPVDDLFLTFVYDQSAARDAADERTPIHH